MDEETCRLCFEHHHEVKKEIEVDTLEILIDSWKLTDLLALCSNKLFSIEKFLRTQKTHCRHGFGTVTALDGRESND